MAQQKNTGSTGLGIAAGIAGGAVFLGFDLLLGIPTLVSIGAGAAVFGIAMVFFKPKPSMNLSGIGEIDMTRVKEVIALGTQQAKSLHGLAHAMDQGETRRLTQSLAHLTEKIVKDVSEDPKDHKAAGKFLDYYAEAAIKICKIYLEVKNRGVANSEFRLLSTKVQNNLVTLEKAFTMQLSKLQEDNLLDLDTELTVLERTLQMEGMLDAINEEEAASKKQP